MAQVATESYYIVLFHVDYIIQNHSIGDNIPYLGNLYRTKQEALAYMINVHQELSRGHPALRYMWNLNPLHQRPYAFTPGPINVISPDDTPDEDVRVECQFNMAGTVVRIWLEEVEVDGLSPAEVRIQASHEYAQARETMERHFL